MSFKHTDNKIFFLVRLLGDGDKFVRDRVTAEFLGTGEDVLPFLEIAGRDERPQVRDQAREIIGLFAQQRLREKFHKLSYKMSENRLTDLEEGVLLIAEFGYPDLDGDALRGTLDSLAKEINSRILPSDTPLEIVDKLTTYLFHEKGFSGNRERYFDADNSYLNKVVLSGKGIPITLTVLCMLIGRRLGLPIEGVGMPAHFIASYVAPEGPIYFDPFGKGRILTKFDCGEIVKKSGLDFDEKFLARSDNRATLLRMIHNLIVVYNRTQQVERAKHLVEYANILNNHSTSLDHIKLI
jgi:regulator of sirC expression with transglutaminase-like and TPR domain